MAKLERELNYDFDELLHRIEQGIMNGSSTASLEDASDFMDSDARCSVRVLKDTVQWEGIVSASILHCSRTVMVR